MSGAMDIEQFLDEAAQANELAKAAHSGDDSRAGNDRKSSRDRDHGRDRRDRDRDRDRTRHRESNGDGRRSRDADRSRRDGSAAHSSHKGANTDEDDDKGRRRDRSRDRGHRRDRARSRDRDRRGGGDYYNPRGRVRSRSPRRDGRDRYRSDRERGDRERSRDREPRRRDEGRGAAAGRRRTPTPEPTEDDRDRRTVFVQQISQRAETRHLRQFFEAVGPVVEAQIVKDRVTGRSKGVGYVEFKDESSVPKALELTGQKLKGVPIIAQLTEAEKNRASRATETATNNAQNNGAPFHRLYVGNIHFSVTEEDLSEVFQPFGALDSVVLQREDPPGGPPNSGRSKGYGFVQFVDPNHAKQALQDMNGFELANRPIRVGLGNDKFTAESTANLMRNFNSQASNFQGSAFSGAGGRGAYAGGSGGFFDRAHGKDDRGVGSASALDDNDIGGPLNNMNRYKLMNALARNPEPEPANDRPKPGQPVANARPALDKPQPSKCIKIEDMFSAEEEYKESGENWQKILEGEVKAECEQKYGKVVHIAVDPNSDGEVYLKFDSVSGGEKAIQGLNGRTFNFRTLRASFVVDKIYNSLFGAAASRM
ncbi:hypothetical protein BDV96DRAFT_485882 [Lophiotrema nucula]|uniref:RRM domain-containing protein n=1 Tax=Lophiotrema nucula TaxID=690887 RepID=A0A6A5ZM76_9PLEO|nr:hypothetical protein BDV96DRAFT_485882 [Lophiotrema nucula]